MAITASVVEAFVDRATNDPEFMERLAQDPFGIAESEGWDVSRDDLREFFAMPGASDDDLVEELKERVSHQAC